MKKMNKKQIAIALLSSAIVGTVAIGGTLAFLTASDEAVNKINIADADELVDVEEPLWDPEEDDDEPLFPGDTKYKDPTLSTKANVYARVKLTFKDGKTGETIKKEDDAERIGLIWQTVKFDPTFEYTTTTDGKIAGTGTYLQEGVSYTEEQINDMVEAGNITTVNDSVFATPVDINDVTDGVYYFYFMGGTVEGKSVPFVLTPDDGKVTLFSNIVVPSDWENFDTDLNPDAHGYITKLGDYDIVVEVQSIQQDNNTTEEITDAASFHTWFEANWSEPVKPETP